MFACDIFDILSLNLACADRSLKNKRSMVICLKIDTEKVKKRTSSLLIIAFSRLKGWGLLWEEVKSPDSSIWYHQMKGWPPHEADWWQGWCGRTADSGAAELFSSQQSCSGISGMCLWTYRKPIFGGLGDAEGSKLHSWNPRVLYRWLHSISSKWGSAESSNCWTSEDRVKGRTEKTLAQGIFKMFLRKTN